MAILVGQRPSTQQQERAQYGAGLTASVTARQPPSDARASVDMNWRRVSIGLSD
jgi:hypothetical protein